MQFKTVSDSSTDFQQSIIANFCFLKQILICVNHKANKLKAELFNILK